MLTLTTKLEAVNAMLQTIGQDPVESLDLGLYDADLAEQYLMRNLKEAQNGDWGYNREEGFPLSPNTAGEIPIPANVMRIDASDARLKVVQWGARLYDKRNHTYQFSGPIACDIQWMLDWEQLPEPVRQYVYTKATHEFQIEKLGSETLAKMTAEDVNQAYIKLQNFDSDTEDYNLFDSDPDAAYIAN